MNFHSHHVLNLFPPNKNLQEKKLPKFVILCETQKIPITKQCDLLKSIK